MYNSTADSYINHKGGTHSMELVLLTLELWYWCMLRDMYLMAWHVPGKTNTLADKESREFRTKTDWKWDPQVIQPFLSGCRTDLFATSLTHQLKRYISCRPDPEALNYDALSVNWSRLGGYAFPPFKKVPAVLNKVLTDQTDNRFLPEEVTFTLTVPTKGTIFSLHFWRDYTAVVFFTTLLLCYNMNKLICNICICVLLNNGVHKI